MGLFSFARNAGEKLFGGKAARKRPSLPPPSPCAVTQQWHNLRKLPLPLPHSLPRRRTQPSNTPPPSARILKNRIWDW